MTGRIIAIYSLKGGVGKTTTAVNLAWAAATLSSRRTLLWDIDGQAAASWVMGYDGVARRTAQDAITRDADPLDAVRRTAIDRLDLLPADASLHGLDILFHELDRKKRLAKIADSLADKYDRIVIDCPPGLSDTSDQIMRAADIVVVPVIPAPLAHRALEVVAQHITSKKGPKVTLVPLFSMVDRRRSLHRAALDRHADWPVIPMASSFESMTDRREPVGAFAPRSSVAVKAIAAAWQAVERSLTAGK